MKEELNITLHQVDLFSVDEFDDRIEYTFWKNAKFDVNQIILSEGQMVKWFTETEVRNMELAYGFNEIVNRFFEKKPFE